MIRYKGVMHLLCQREGSIIPFAVSVALPCAIISGGLKYLEVNKLAGTDVLFDIFKIKGAAYGSFSSLLGFLIVFRTSQAYSRFWVGSGLLQQMVGSWFDAASSIHSFCRLSKAKADETTRFEHLVLRLFSLMSALALLELEGCDGDEDAEDCESDSEGFISRLNQLELIDIESLDTPTLEAIKHSDNKIELIFNWLQVIMVDAMDKGILCIAPPVLARAFLELGDGLAKFHDCMKIAALPFPFPYSQASLVLLVFHWLITPMMICVWTENWALSALFSFLVIFIFWGLYAIATELENPFGDDPNDLDAVEVQREMNAKLLLLITEANTTTPTLKQIATEDLDTHALRKRTTLQSVWTGPRKVGHYTNLGGSLRRITTSESNALLLSANDSDA